MTKLLDGFASVETKRMDNGHIIAIIRKKTEQNELPIQLQTYVDDRKDKRVCHKSVTHPFLFFAFSQIRNL